MKPEHYKLNCGNKTKSLTRAQFVSALSTARSMRRITQDQFDGFIQKMRGLKEGDTLTLVMATQEDFDRVVKALPSIPKLVSSR